MELVYAAEGHFRKLSTLETFCVYHVLVVTVSVGQLKFISTAQRGLILKFSLKVCVLRHPARAPGHALTWLCVGLSPYLLICSV